ncbi:MAG: hypothetical protein NC086_08875, partial [Alistipes sp.]|nr:hypothetical protein [Alistipes sp.]
HTSDVHFGRTDYKGLEMILIPPNSGELKSSNLNRYLENIQYESNNYKWSYGSGKTNGRI